MENVSVDSVKRAGLLLPINRLHLEPHVESNPLLEHVYRAANVIPILVDIPFKRIRYLGINSVSWCGWTLNELFEEGYESYTKKIHPDDQLVLTHANDELNAYLKDCVALKDKFNLVSLCTYRFMHKAGHYRLYKEQLQPIEFDVDGNLSAKLILLTDVTDQLPVHTHYVRTYGVKGKEKLAQIDTSQKRITKLQALSEREREVVRYLMQGFNSAEIGEKVFVSKHTVDTHRRRILQKLRANDTVSLYNLFTMLQLNG